MQRGSGRTRRKNGVRHKLLGLTKTACFCVRLQYLIFLTHAWDRQNTHSPVTCNELHVRPVHLTTSVGLAAVLRGSLSWQHTTAAALLLLPHGPGTTRLSVPGSFDQLYRVSGALCRGGGWGAGERGPVSLI